jgi:hypothetical protein
LRRASPLLWGLDEGEHDILTIIYDFEIMSYIETSMTTPLVSDSIERVPAIYIRF